MKNLEVNKLIAKALRNISENDWNGTTLHTNLTDCLTGINLSTGNSGWYNPTAITINDLKGIYMINQDGSIFPEARIIKLSENEFKIEYLSLSGWNQFENLYCQLIEN
jgi:hypothetical protein